MKEKNINSLRFKIDKVDDSILELIEKRFEYVSEIKEIKDSRKIEITDLKREDEIINRLISNLGNKRLNDHIVKIYQSILTESKKYQKK